MAYEETKGDFSDVESSEEDDDGDTINILKQFNLLIKNYFIDIVLCFKKYNIKPFRKNFNNATCISELIEIRRKYGFKRKKGRPTINVLFYASHLPLEDLVEFHISSYLDICPDLTPMKHLRIIYKYKGRKFSMLKKHAQSMKTFIAIQSIIRNRKCCFTIVFCKNTKPSTLQYYNRLKEGFKKMNIPLKNIAVIMSGNRSGNNSKDNDECVHFRNFAEFRADLTNNDVAYDVIFVCGNNTRIPEMATFINPYFTNEETLNKLLGNRKITIQIDEAHSRDAIPSYGGYYYSMCVNPLVEEIMLITATEEQLIKDNRVFSNCRRIAYDSDYNVSSNDPHYSSIKDAKHVLISDVTDTTGDFSDGDTLPREMLEGIDVENRVLETEDKIKIIKKQKDLVIQNAPQTGDEASFLNFIISKRHQITSNILETNYKNEYNIKMISIVVTPCRKIITLATQNILCQHRGTIVIAILCGHLIVRKKNFETNKIEFVCIRGLGKGSAGLNDHIDTIIQENKEEFYEKHIIIVSNSINVGESVTIVHSNYGYISRLIMPPFSRNSKTPKEDSYQTACRACFMLTKFNGLKKEDVNKEIWASERSLDSANDYEKSNDEWLLDKSYEDEYTKRDLERDKNTIQEIEKKRKKIIPIKGVMKLNKDSDTIHQF